jgi:short-subunit dehydrogenase
LEAGDPRREVSQTILVLGATSAIASAYCRRLAPSGASFVLVGRDLQRLVTVGADLTARGARHALTLVADLTEVTAAEARFVEFCVPLGTPDQIVLAYGVPSNQAAAENDPGEIRRIIDTNFTSAAVWLHAAAKQIPPDKTCSLIVVSSVAGDRGRRSNYVYGASKAGLDAFTEGLRHRLSDTRVHVLTVKPGLVDTPMTSHLNRSGPLWATPDRVAADIEKAVRRRRRVAYTPWFWRLIMFVIRSLPRALFYRTNF